MRHKHLCYSMSLHHSYNQQKLRQSKQLIQFSNQFSIMSLFYYAIIVEQYIYQQK
ncbi:hypothetical protein pb186bvf_016202 [Paramecium bursaria]